jgi:predicted aspartyl protease
MTRIAALLALLVAAPACHDRPETVSPVDHATVSLLVEGNRPFIDVTFKKPDGTKRSARFLVDSGGGGFLLLESLARDLGLQWGKTEREEGSEFAKITNPPEAFVGEFPLELNPDRVLVEIGADNIVPKAAPGHAEGVLPGHVLSRYHVVFDYPNATFTIARAGVLTPVGAAMPMPVGRPSGFPRTEIEVDGVTHGFLVDTGASFTMVSEALLKSWGSAHPAWERHTGAFGEAATLGGQTIETMFVPGARWGTRALGKLGVTSQKEGTFERWMSAMMKKPIVGSLAGNVLKGYRIELDYPNEMLYVSAP